MLHGALCAPSLLASPISALCPCQADLPHWGKLS